MPAVTRYRPTWSSYSNFYSPARDYFSGGRVSAAPGPSPAQFDDHWHYPGRTYSTYHSFHYPRRYYFSSYVPGYTYTLYQQLPGARSSQ